MIASANKTLETLSHAELIALAHSQHSTINILQSENHTLRLQRDLYKEQLNAKLRALYAAQSEVRHNPKQSDLFFNEAEVLGERTSTADDTLTVAAHQKKKAGRKPLDANLPREIVRIELSEAERICAHDGSTLREIGVEASEQLDIIPAQLKVIRTERVKYACSCCDLSITVAPAPTKLIPKGLFTENALAWITIAKYQDGLPLYRQAPILNRCGGDVVRNTLARNMVECGERVQPLINLLRDQWLDAPLKHMDETTVQVLKEDGRAAQTKSYFWLRACDSGPPLSGERSGAVRLFTYAPSRSGKTARELLDGAHGTLMTDGYEPYNEAARVNALVHLGCWVHARRYFMAAENELPKAQRGKAHPASQIIALIGELYGVEKHANEHHLSEVERGELRREKSTVIVTYIETQLLALLTTTAPQSLLGKALIYLQGQWPKLIRFLDNGAWPLDNNMAENAIRPFVIGRKNWLFSDTVGGANASANLYSLIETAKANGLDPFRYLAHLFRELPKAKTVEQIEALLPWKVSLSP